MEPKSVSIIPTMLFCSCFFRTGCEQCCCTFRICSSPVLAQRNYFYGRENTVLAQRYPLPSELLVADPPLTPEIAQWLAGKYERRISYLRGYQETENQFHRINSCGLPSDTGFRSYSNVVITKDSLKGTFSMACVTQHD